jgi:hypothetical protein
MAYTAIEYRCTCIITHGTELRGLEHSKAETIIGEQAFELVITDVRFCFRTFSCASSYSAISLPDSESSATA